MWNSASFSIPVWFIWLTSQTSYAFVPSSQRNRNILAELRFPRTDQFQFSLGGSSNEDGESGDDDEAIDLGDKDWRAFRAKLVMGESSEKPPSTVTTMATPDDDDLDGIGALFNDDIAKLQETMTPLDPSQWAYDSGKVIEQGAVILGGVEQSYGFGLRQQYFHKCAILVLDHQESTFTKGIILNRPTDMTLEDNMSPGVQWRVWFGGDVQGIGSRNLDIVCLHTLKNEMVTRASVPVMNDLQWTTFDAAKKLVRAGHAKPTDFWVFVGYCGWGPGQLMGEIDRKSWYMVATDSQTLLKELARNAAAADPRDAGLDTWYLLMKMIGRSDIAEEHTGGFDDLILKEWARKNLLSHQAGGGAGNKIRLEGRPGSLEESESPYTLKRLMRRVPALKVDVKEGTLLRASSAERSPFLLEDQELHKSVVLLIMDDDDMSVGVILNRPGAKGLEVRVQEKDSGKGKTLSLPLRYGGPFQVKGSEPLLWLHCNSKLKAAKIGAPIGNDVGIWKCISKDVITAVGQGLATPEDFMVVTGVSVWTKGETGRTNGMKGEIRKGRFEVIPEWKIQDVWDVLSQQEVLDKENFVKNILIAGTAWSRGAGSLTKTNGESETTPISGLGEGFDEEDDGLVFKSDIPVSKLSDDALRSWVATFLLGEPSLGEQQ